LLLLCSAFDKRKSKNKQKQFENICLNLTFMTALSSLQRRLESALEALQQLGLAYAGDGSKKNEINSAMYVTAISK
jgi:hypothetical protein